MKQIILIITALLLQGCSVFGIRTVEMLRYDQLEKNDNFDIRQYQDYWVAQTLATGDYKESTGDAFRRLFRYISGENSLETKISMTGPVLQQKGEKIAMTGPVIQQQAGPGWQMEFVLPEKYNKAQPPQPLDPLVRVIKKPGYIAAALQYSGTLNEDRLEEKKKELLDMVDARGLGTIGEPFSAGYDPPWTVPFLRRNEVLVIIDQAPATGP